MYNSLPSGFSKNFSILRNTKAFIDATKSGLILLFKILSNVSV